MAELTLGAVRAAAEACAGAWGAARVDAAARGGGAPRFDAVFARWPLLGGADALDVALSDVALPDVALAEAGPDAPPNGVPARWLARWLAAARLRAAVAPYEARVAEWARGAVVRVPGGAAVAWGEVPDRLAGLAGDAVTRRALGAARAALGAAELAPLARERAARACAAVEGLGVAAGYDDTFARVAGEPPAARAALAADWLGRTEAAWADTLAERARRTVGLAARELVAADLPAVLAGNDEASPRGSALAAAARAQLAALGLDPDAGGRVRVGVLGAGATVGGAGGAPSGVPFGAAALAGRAAARAVPVRVPSEVYLLARTGAAAARASGPGAARGYLDALGRALHRAHADPALPFEARWAAGAVRARATGALLAALLRDRGWLRRYAALSGGALDGAARAAAFRELAAARGFAARTTVSAAAYGDEVALGDVEAVYADRARAAFGVAPDPGDAMADLDAPFAVGDALGGVLAAGALADALRDRFDEDWWRNPRAGPWLAAEWFAGGGASGGGEGAGPTAAGPLAAALVRALQ